ncbi:MAG: choice-of-anchor J domain-containing protein [Prevotella sp.]|nr:choice-of-anchor J domain-containing protein [Prevotella sp.]MCM1075243.1 choice-of-anchor J domain-containing protein [Ruminococcus sp.]
MKHYLLLSVGLACCLWLQAQIPAGQSDKVEINFSESSWKMPVKATLHVGKEKKAPGKVQKRENAENNYKAVVQSFQDYDYNFTTTCGEASVYNATVTLEGNTVKFLDLLTYDEYMLYYGYVSQEVTGVYDEETKTVTISTPYTSGNDATIVGRDDANTYAIMAGDYDGYEFFPTGDLVFDVIGDFEQLRSRQQIAVVEVYDDELGYLSSQFASLMLQSADSPNSLLVIPREMDMGESYPDSQLKGILQFINLSDDNITYAATTDKDGLTLDPAVGTVDTYYPEHVFVNYQTSAVGKFSISLPVAYETATMENSVNLTFSGNVIDFPDYSTIVKGGEVNFATGNEFPFGIIDTEEGGKAAVSTGKQWNQKSWLEARVTVSENHIGKFSYKGSAKCTVEDNPYAGFYAKIYIDPTNDEYNTSEPYFTTEADADFAETIELNPGEHKIRFEFTPGYLYGEDYSQYGMTINEITFVDEAAKAEGVDILTPALDFGGLMVDKEPAQKMANIELRNSGTSPLKAVAFTSTDPAFTAELPDGEAPLMGTLTIPVTITADKAGKYEAELTVETSAGAVTVNATAIVRATPDFTAILDGEKSLVTVTTTADNPFVMSEDGKAYNANSGEADNMQTQSVILFTINVPDGKLAHISWDAVQSADAGEYTSIKVGGGFALQFVYGEGDASDKIFDFQKNVLELVPGNHNVEFKYVKNGDGIISGDDRLTISRFDVTTEDFDAKAFEITRPQVRFADCILPDQGKNTKRIRTTVNLINNGSEELRCLRDDELQTLPDNPPFFYTDPGYVAWHGASLMVDLIFYPETEGKYEGVNLIPTTFGDVEINCTGYAYHADGMILIQDMENAASGWTLVDKDGDGNGWTPVSEKIYYRPDTYCFSGSDALISNSNVEGTVDNYAVSPEFSVPADGGILTWWVAPGDKLAAAESYEVSIIPSDEYADAKLGTYKTDFSETLDDTHYYWKQSTLDLALWAGKKVRAVYHHNTPAAQSTLRLDDVYAYTTDKWSDLTSSLKAFDFNGDVVSEEYFDLTGMRVSPNAIGILIKRTILSNGTVKIQKIIK